MWRLYDHMNGHIVYPDEITTNRTIALRIVLGGLACDNRMSRARPTL